MARYRGTAGNDTVTGATNQQNQFSDYGQGLDTLTGGNRADTFNLTVDHLWDRVDGGDGVDTVNYSGADRGLLIDLQFGYTSGKFFFEARPVEGGNGWISGEEEKIVTELDNIENVVGSRHNDIIVGSNSDNVIEGGGGADWIHGADGNDTVSYAGSSAGVVVSLTSGSAAGGDAQGDTLISIENVIGSEHGDTIVGNRENNVFTGGDGNDAFLFFRGAIGHDTITDFDASGRDHDVIEFAGVFRNFDELRQHAEAHGNDVVITIDEHNSITLQGVRLNQLDEGDFFFS
jgi:Ca2+-binding RTX toxin-like protein